MSEETSISDLLPLVAAALNDKAAADAAKELAAAREERDVPRKVEVIRSLNNGDDEDEDGDIVVYASSMFEDGQYARNTNLWDVTLEQNSSNVCPLANLRDCHICVGGGFPVASLDDTLPNNAGFYGMIDGDESDEGGESTDGACKVSFNFGPHGTWLTILIYGWPREAWEAVIQADAYETEDIIHFLVDVIASQYPEATVEFKEVTFATGSIHGALKRLLPPKRKEEVRADRDRRNAESDPEGDALYDFVARAMRERGNHASRALFLPQLYSIMGFLAAIGVDRLGVNDELIMTTISTAISTHERFGDEGLLELFDQFGPDTDVEEVDGEGESEEDDEEDCWMGEELEVVKLVSETIIELGVSIEHLPILRFLKSIGVKQRGEMNDAYIHIAVLAYMYQGDEGLKILGELSAKTIAEEGEGTIFDVEETVEVEEAGEG